jgi:hypothetical protein
MCVCDVCIPGLHGSGVGDRQLREIKLERHLQYALVSKEPTIPAQEPYYQGKEPYYRTNEPFYGKWYALVSKEPYYKAKEPYYRKVPCQGSRGMSKEPYLRSKRALLQSKRALLQKGTVSRDVLVAASIKRVLLSKPKSPTIKHKNPTTERYRVVGVVLVAEAKAHLRHSQKSAPLESKRALLQKDILKNQRPSMFNI